MAPRRSFEDWVRREATLAGSDGCTLATELFRFCCLVHDLEYRKGKSARSAYICYRLGRDEDPWASADPISRRQADAGFRRCMWRRSKVKRASPVAFGRWVFVRLGAWPTWQRYRRA